jgi:hypothetical protein
MCIGFGPPARQEQPSQLARCLSRAQARVVPRCRECAGWCAATVRGVRSAGLMIRDAVASVVTGPERRSGEGAEGAAAVSWPGHSAGASRTTQGAAWLEYLPSSGGGLHRPPSVSPAGPAAASSVPCRRVTHERLPAARGRRRLLSGVRAAACIRTRNGRGDAGRAAYDLAVAGGEDRPATTAASAGRWIRSIARPGFRPISPAAGSRLDRPVPGRRPGRGHVPGPRQGLCCRAGYVMSPIQARDPLTLICSSEAFPGQGWIEDQIPPMVDYQAARWQGPEIMGSSKTCRSWASDAPTRPAPPAGRS